MPARKKPDDERQFQVGDGVLVTLHTGAIVDGTVRQFTNNYTDNFGLGESGAVASLACCASTVASLRLARLGSNWKKQVERDGLPTTREVHQQPAAERPLKQHMKRKSFVLSEAQMATVETLTFGRFCQFGRFSALAPKFSKIDTNPHVFSQLTKWELSILYGRRALKTSHLVAPRIC